MAMHCRHLSSLTSKLYKSLACPRTLQSCQLPQSTLLQALGVHTRPTISLRSITVARASFTDQNLASEATVGEIDWSPDRINAVSLIGSLGRDLELRYLANGSVVGNVALAVKRTQDKTDWFELEVWGALAERAKDVVRKGSRVHVEGRLKVDEWTDSASNSKRSRTKVVVRSLNLIRATPIMEPPLDVPPAEASWQQLATQPAYQPAPQAAAPPPPPAPAPPAAAPPAPSHPAAAPTAAAAQYLSEPREGADPSDPVHRKWLDYFDNPTSYWDNRLNKRNPRAPDFKHKERADALWISGRDTPSWVVPQLEFIDAVREEDIPF